MKADAVLAEGPVWHDGRLWWVDIERCEIHALDVATGTDRKWTLASRVGFAVPRGKGGFIVGTEHGLSVWDDGRMEPLAHPEEAKPGNRFNDAKCDPQGRLWAGTMAMSEAPEQGALYRVDARGVSKMVDAVSISNGLAWSPDGATMYYIDSPTRRVDAFDFRDGEIANRRTVITLEDGFPDGMCDCGNGTVIIAFYNPEYADAGRAVRYRLHTGEVLDEWLAPGSPRVTCPLLFEEAGAVKLLLTTADEGMAPELRAKCPNAGCLFVADTGLPAVPPAEVVR